MSGFKNVAFENARIVFRNFTGKEGKFNAAGMRNFCLLLAPDVAAELKAEGWNIRSLPPLDPDGDPQAYVQVKVAFNKMPPKIILITGTGKKSPLTEETVHILDWAEIQRVDLILNPYAWEVSGKGGVKPYLKSMYVTLVPDDFEGRYAEFEVDVPDSAASNLNDRDL